MELRSFFRSIEELDFYKSLFKTEGKRSLYEKALEIGLEPLALKIINGNSNPTANSLINPKVDGLKTKSEVIKGAQDILVHLIVKNKLIMEEIRKLKEKFSVKIEAKKATTAKDSKDAHKFENYFNFSTSSTFIKAHQVLALFRGENLKILKISFIIDDRFPRELFKFTESLLMKSKSREDCEIFKAAFDEAFNKRISSFLKRQHKNELQKFADKAAISSFAENLKNLLLARPVRGRKVLGIDPGFKHGCKLAMMNEHGDLLETRVIFPHSKIEESKKILVELLKSHNCDLIALGNGTACRETENFINEIIGNVEGLEYCIVSEQGASIYSCTEIAKKEFPGEDLKIYRI